MPLPPSVRVQFVLDCRCMLQGNGLPTVLEEAVLLGQCAEPLRDALSKSLKKIPGTGKVIVDAHNIQGLSADAAIAGMAEAVYSGCAMPPEEFQLRGQIADVVCLSMGPYMTHFEAPIDKATGTVRVDHVFKPLVLDASKGNNDHLPHLHAFDPEKMKCKDCITMHFYHVDTDAQTGRRTPVFICAEPLDLRKLMARSIAVTEAAPLLSEGKGATVVDPAYVFAGRNNFGNTLMLNAVLPFFPDGHAVVVGTHSETHPHHRRKLHMGLSIASAQPPTQHEEQHLQKLMESMKAELKKLEDGVAAYEQAKRSGEDTTHHPFMTSALRLIPHMQSAVKLQQGLMQAYCMHGVESSSVMLSEPCSLQFASGATCMQPHGAHVCFQVMTDVHNAVTAKVPMKQIITQYWAAMVRSGLTPQDVMGMKAQTHGSEIAALLNATISAAELDQVQTGYNYDLCLHSVMPVSAEDAKANLQPVPGQIEYAPGCVARQYKLHTLLNTKSGKEYQQWFGYNLAVTEDLNPMRAFHTISDCIAHVDCEDYAGNNIALANSIMNVKQFLSTSKQATLEDVMHSRIHDFSVVSAAGDAVRTAPAPPSTQEELQVGVLQSLHHLLGQVRDLKVESVMGMAHGGQAGAADQSLTGHAYSLITCKLSDGKDYINIIEGTKWVQADDAGATNRVCRNAGLPTPVLQTLDQIAQLCAEGTKLDKACMFGKAFSATPEAAAALAAANPQDDKAGWLLEIHANKGPNFYANAYVQGNKSLLSQSVPGVESSALVMGVPLTYLLYNVQCMQKMPVEFHLTEQHLMGAGCADIQKGEVKNMIMSVVRDAAPNTWDGQDWEEKVFSTQLPCKMLVHNPEVTKAFVPGKQCCVTFTHQLARKGAMTMEVAQRYADNIVRVLEKGQEEPPCITHAHLERILHDGFPPGTPAEARARVQGFDVEAANAKFMSAVAGGRMRVESIATCMGCVMATVVMDVDQIPAIAKGMMGWATPIMQANAAKSKVCLEQRKVLESRFCVGGGVAEGALMQQMLRMRMHKEEEEGGDAEQEQKHGKGEKEGLGAEMVAVGELFDRGMEAAETHLLKLMASPVTSTSSSSSSSTSSCSLGHAAALGVEVVGPSGWLKRLYSVP